MQARQPGFELWPRRRQQVWLSYLKQLFSRLRRDGVVESTRGPRRLSRGSARALLQPYRYFGSHSVKPGQMYMNTMHRMTMSM